MKAGREVKLVKPEKVWRKSDIEHLQALVHAYVKALSNGVVGVVEQPRHHLPGQRPITRKWRHELLRELRSKCGTGRSNRGCESWECHGV